MKVGKMQISRDGRIDIALSKRINKLTKFLCSSVHVARTAISRHQLIVIHNVYITANKLKICLCYSFLPVRISQNADASVTK